MRTKPARKVLARKKVIASRRLRDLRNGEAVDIALYEPEQERPPNGDWACHLEIRREGKGSVSTLTGRGIDSLQALLTALDAIRHALRPELSTLTLTGTPGEIGLPIIVPEQNADFAALIEHLVGAEYCRQIIAAKRYGPTATRGKKRASRT